MSERRRVRIDRRVDGTEGALDRLSRPDYGRGQNVLLKVVNGGAMPDFVPAVFRGSVVAPVGPEVVGGSESFPDTGGAVLPVTVLGPGVPVQGDILEAKTVGGRWVAHFGGASKEIPPCTLKILVATYDCGGTAVPGELVTVTGPGGFSATCTTVLSGFNAQCLVTVPAYGTYTVTAMGGSETVVMASPMCLGHAVFCGGPTVPDTKAKVCGTLYGCSCPLVGRVVTFWQGGVQVGTATTDANGKFCSCIKNVTQALTIRVDNPPTRFAFGLWTVPAGVLTLAQYGCRLLNLDQPALKYQIGTGGSFHYGPLSLSPASGYHCACSCNVPVKDVVFLHDLFYGTVVTLTFTGSFWAGKQTVDYPGCFTNIMGCAPVAGYEINYQWPASCSTGGGCDLLVIDDVIPDTACPENLGWSQGWCLAPTTPPWLCNDAPPCPETLFLEYGVQQNLGHFVAGYCTEFDGSSYLGPHFIITE